jgi:hypothetical protein
MEKTRRFHVEEFDPDPFMEALNKLRLTVEREFCTHFTG